MNNLVKAVSDHYDADIYLYYGMMFPPDDTTLIQEVRRCKRRKNILLLIETPGGSAEVAYRIGRAAQRAYNTKSGEEPGKFYLYVHEVCKSAGTILALAADELIISQLGELGPIDVQLRKDDEVGERTSGLTPHQALETLQVESGQHFERFFRQLRFSPELNFSTKLSADLAAQLVVGLMGPVYAQLDPARLGEVERHVRVSSEYGQRLRTSNVKDATIARLGASYPSHEFVIDRREARQLFERVSRPTDDLEALADALANIKARVMSSGESAILCLNQESENASECDAAESASNAGVENSSRSGEGEKPSNGSVRPARTRARKSESSESKAESQP